MDPIESMLRSINPVPDDDAVPGSHSGVDSTTWASDGAGDARAPRPPRSPKKPRVRARAMAFAVAAVVVMVAAGVFGMLTQAVFKPQPAGPTVVPSPTSTASLSPTPTDTPTALEMDPATGIDCSFANVTVTDQTGQMLANMRQYPEDFHVLGCADEWLAFELTDDGYQRLVSQGAGTSSGNGDGERGDFYFAKFDGSNYLYNKYVYLRGWDTIQVAGGTPADKAAAMDKMLQRDVGIAAQFRPKLIGEPAPQAGTPPPATESNPAPDLGSGLPCNMEHVKAVDNPEAWIMQDINAHPENYTVLGCSGGWLSFKLSDAGFQQWLDTFEREGLIQERSPFFHFAALKGNDYEFKLGNSVPNWDPRPGIDPRPEELIKTMEHDMDLIGVPAPLREALVGSPPE